MRFDIKNEENDDDRSSIRVKDVNYFDSNYFEDFNVFIANVEKHVYYRNVFVFINKLKDMIKQRGSEALKSIVLICFRDKTLR